MNRPTMIVHPSHVAAQRYSFRRAYSFIKFKPQMITVEFSVNTYEEDTSSDAQNGP